MKRRHPLTCRKQSAELLLVSHFLGKSPTLIGEDDDYRKTRFLPGDDEARVNAEFCEYDIGNFRKI